MDAKQSGVVSLFLIFRSFGGFANLTDYTREGHLLAASLPAHARVDMNYYFTAGYDSPSQFLNRHNEVWLVRAAPGGQ